MDMNFVQSAAEGNASNSFLEITYINIVGQNIPVILRDQIKPEDGEITTIYGFELLQTNSESILNDLISCQNIDKSEFLITISNLPPFFNKSSERFRQELITNGYDCIILNHFDFLEMLENRNLNMNFDPNQLRFGEVVCIDENSETLQILKPTLIGYQTLYDGTATAGNVVGSSINTLNYHQLFKLFLILNTDTHLYRTEEEFIDWFHNTLNMNFENKGEDELLTFSQTINNEPIYLYNTKGIPAFPKTLEVFGFFSNMCLQDTQLKFSEDTITLPYAMSPVNKIYAINRTKSAIQKHNNKISRKYNVPAILMAPDQNHVGSISVSVGNFCTKNLCTSTSIVSDLSTSVTTDSAVGCIGIGLVFLLIIGSFSGPRRTTSKYLRYHLGPRRGI